jgi:hypothetical protein
MTFQSASKFLRQNWGLVILVLIGLTLFLLYLRPGHFLIGNDNFSPELDPWLTVNRIIANPGYREYRSLGYASDTEAVELYRALIYSILSLVLPTWFISQAYYLIGLLVGPISVYFIVKGLLKRSPSATWHELAAFMGGMVYLFNLQTVNVYFYTNALFAAAYAFTPLFILATQNLLAGKFNLRNNIFFAVASILVAGSAITVTMFAVIMCLWAAISLVFIQYRQGLKYNLQRVGSMLGILFVLHAYWLLPMGYYFVANADQVVSSYISRAITPNIIANEEDFNSLGNTLTYNFAWVDTKLSNNEFTFTYRDYYQTYLGTLSQVLIIVMGFLGLVYLLYKHRNPKYAILGIIYILGLLLIAARAEPAIYPIFHFLEQNLPYFAQIMRWASSKLWIMMTLPLALLAGIGFGFLAAQVLSLANHLKNRFLRIGYTSVLGLGVALLGILPVGYLALPFFYDALVYDRYYVQIPKEYVELAGFIKKSDPHGRIYLAPESNTLYFHNHDWSGEGDFSMNKGPGFWGSGFLQYMLPNPLVDKTLAIGSNVSEEAQRLIDESLHTADVNKFKRALNLFAVNYILLDTSKTSIAQGYDINWDLYKQLVNENNFIKKWQQGNLSLWEVPKLDIPVQVTSTNYNLRNYTASQLTQNQSSSLLALDFDRLEYVDNRIIATVSSLPSIYSGRQISLQSIDVTQLPLTAAMRGDKLIISAAFPTISAGNITVLNPTTLSYNLPAGIEYININGQLIRSGESRTLKDKAGTPLTIEMYAGNSKTTDYFEYLKTRELTDCTNFESGTPFSLTQGLIKLHTSRDERCSAVDIDITSDSVNTIKVQVIGKGEELMRFCFWSTAESRCLNQANTLILKSGLNEINYTLPVSSIDQKIILNFRWQSIQDVSSEITFIGLAKSTLTKTASSVVNTDNLTVVANNTMLQAGAQLYLSMPLIDAYNLKSEYPLLPDVNLGDCGGNIENSSANLSFTVQGCLVSIYKDLELSGLQLVFAKTQNYSGIPLDIQLSDKLLPQNNRLAYRERTAYQQSASFLQLLGLPQAKAGYGLLISNLGFKKTASQNTVEEFIISTVPAEWLKLGAVSPAETGKCVVPTRYAAEPGWFTLSTNAQPVQINGWAQGFYTDCTPNPTLNIMHLSNLLGYIGYIILIGGLAMICKQRILARRSSSTG